MNPSKKQNREKQTGNSFRKNPKLFTTNPPTAAADRQRSCRYSSVSSSWLPLAAAKPPDPGPGAHSVRPAPGRAAAAAAVGTIRQVFRRSFLPRYHCC